MLLNREASSTTLDSSHGSVSRYIVEVSSYFVFWQFSGAITIGSHYWKLLQTIDYDFSNLVHCPCRWYKGAAGTLGTRNGHPQCDFLSLLLLYFPPKTEKGKNNPYTDTTSSNRVHREIHLDSRIPEQFHDTFKSLVKVTLSVTISLVSHTCTAQI